MRPDRASMLGRLTVILGGLLLVGIVFRLYVGILESTLPPLLMGGIAEGFTKLLTILDPALGSIMALLILTGLCYIVLGRRR